MKRQFRNVGFVIIGLILVASGLALVKLLSNPQGLLLALPYVCIGLGCGVFGQGIGAVISQKVIKNHPDIEKQIEIDQKDERNITIARRAKAKAYDIMIPVFGALLLTFALMGVDLIIVLLSVSAYLFIVFYGIYYRFKYDREM
ncbi:MULTISPECIES: hypothetical protein [Acetobacterium]|jgi:hypothetical protein|uniref:hypothetical protein n=1 Tax=Acetobacterium TaxID=33951 RepID=UPI000DBEBE5F|nr:MULTISPECIES: hypothetical protein [unclassified Acetobacterium]AWW27483.1 hypothetical protein DOZ58_13080 [Acetobacterium sp. KB-1]MDZ5726075.1 hypothetical protein [Acetobacterium sp. K1/6]